MYDAVTLIKTTGSVTCQEILYIQYFLNTRKYCVHWANNSNSNGHAHIPKQDDYMINDTSKCK